MSLQVKDEPVRLILTAAFALVIACLPVRSAASDYTLIACPSVESVPTERNTYLMPETTTETTSEATTEEPKKREGAQQEAGQTKPSQPDNGNGERRTRPYVKKKIGMKGVVA
jgi:hypothetical protein